MFIFHPKSLPTGTPPVELAVAATATAHAVIQRGQSVVAIEVRRNVDGGCCAQTPRQLKLAPRLVTKQRTLPQRSCFRGPVIAGVITRHAVTATSTPTFDQPLLCFEKPRGFVVANGERTGEGCWH